ncbi:methylated-DNA--[protein]-cysteine S-methyltransferase [Endozoicomonas numazuensis]|uniref:methylated-DNA--[protein]-cysteine S-methyltransferase n=1 Tax=Endozoicomonas numazuensis TaxID=1137799 RepID=A0A081NGF4_9GAMM|nr:methylated-DNA--[protein]-cysteine S-methyltransferase [Endozoicomonas numazuensis]KEQ17527.1 6-O-methylguanine DNA methyltransferase [Endozoicomonas numazuensis]
MSKEYSEEHRQYQQVSKAIAYLSGHWNEQPGLADVASHVGLSEFHLQRVFSEWAGISPKQFLQFLTREYARQQLRNNSVLDTALSSGLSGSSRLHDLMLSWESMSPGAFKAKGKGIEIAYGIHESPFGYCLIAQTARGICKLSFFDHEEDQEGHEQELRKEWPDALIHRSDCNTASVARQIFDRDFNQQPLHLILKGTPFQLKVWEALLAIPQGQLYSYQQLAEKTGKPSAVRAVASAVARNNIGFLIPCHRVIRGTGEINQYRWGAERKQVLIVHEAVGIESNQATRK